MKKLFLAFMLLTGFVLASCGTNDAAGKSGDVSFSISGNEIGRYLAARNSDDTENDKIEFAVLAQIKGSKGYHAWQMGKAYYTPSADSTVVQEGSTNPNTSVAGMYDLPDEIKKHVQSLEFSFKDLPLRQAYTVMVDVFKKVDGRTSDISFFSDAWNISLSGETSDIGVKAGNSTPVTVELFNADMDQNNFDFKVSYKKNNQTQTELIPLDYDSLSKYKFSKDEKNIYFSHAGRGQWYAISDLKLVIDSSSHFSKGASFSLVQIDYADPTVAGQAPKKKVVAQASKGEIDLLPMCLVKEEGSDGGLYKTIELDFEGIVLYQNLHLYIGEEKENFGSFSSYENNYKFVKDTQASDEAKNRFVMTIPLEDIFGEEPLEKGDSIAFLLNNLTITRSNNGGRVTSNKLAYQLQKAGWEQDDPTKRYADNTTIDISALSDPLVLASNFINGDEKYLQIYVDLEKSYNNVNELDATFGIDYKVFPASDKVYIFHTNFDSYGDHTYRFDMNIKLNSYLKASGRKPIQASTVTVPVGGTFYWVSNYGKSIPEEGYYVYGNFIDNAGYVEYGSTTESWYHILSGEMSNGIKPDGSIDAFAFEKITKPHEKQGGDKYFVDNDFGLQCYYRLNEEDSTSNLFIIENFSIGASVDGEFTIWDVN